MGWRGVAVISRLFLGLLVMGGVVAATMFVLFLVQSPQLTQADLPVIETEPTPTPTPSPTLPPVEVHLPSGPRNFVPAAYQFPTPYVPIPIDLNLDRDRYDEMGLTAEQSTAIFRLRCEPPVPPRTPYSGHLDGCNGPGAGIMYLDEIVEAGIMSRQEVNDAIAGRTVQQWRP
jgi:hypothetical protein